MTRCLATLALIAALAAPSPAADPVDYARDIKPLLKERCFACHGALKQKGKLRLDTAALMAKGGTSGPAIKPGDTAASLVLERVSDTDESTRMPPEGKPLTAEQVAKLKAWIAEGAKAPADEKSEADPRDHWAFRPPVRPPLPSVADPQWSHNPIDRFLAAEWKKRGLTPAPEADRATLLRRVYLDLIGLPPTRDELHAFLADTSPEAYEKVVEKLLASPRYGERWARHWMDVWRYSDWYGRRGVPDVLNSYAQVWRWRDWIVAGVNADRGYDDMVRMMLAADELAPGDDAEAVATGFVVRNFFRWNYNNWMRDNVEHTGKAFLGLTLNCCHCHDHKYDPITQEEYFRFRAVFEPIEIRHERAPGQPDPGPYPKYKYGAAYKPITSGMVRVMDERLDAKTHFYTGGDERNVAKDRPPVPPGVPAALGGTFAVSPVELPPESWYPGLKPFVRREETAKRDETVRAAAIGLLAALRGDDPAAVRLAVARFIVAKADLAALQARIAADDVKNFGVKGDPKVSAEAASRAERQFALDTAVLAQVQAEVAIASAKKGKDAAKTAAAEKQLAVAKAQAEAARKALAVASPKYTLLSPVYPKASTGRRAALARWITDRSNPLTARVAVNHVWGWHFGSPLVETTNNFGRSGKPPTHPELLDWLAVEFMDHGWQTKHLHRLIVTSRAYRMSSTMRNAESGMRNEDIPAAAVAGCAAVIPHSAFRAPHSIDPDNLFIWRFPTNRMEAEVVRDSLLHVAGELDLTAGGPEISQAEGLTSRRRSLYLSHHGETRTEFLDLFDAANPCDAYRRTTSVLPQQALALTNSELAHRLSRVVAGKLSAAKADEEFVRAAFEQLLSRPPREAEEAASAKFLARQRELHKDTKGVDAAARSRENLILALFNHTDFVTVR
jgi:hypothetical protein